MLTTRKVVFIRSNPSCFTTPRTPVVSYDLGGDREMMHCPCGDTFVTKQGTLQKFKADLVSSTGASVNSFLDFNPVTGFSDDLFAHTLAVD